MQGEPELLEVVLALSSASRLAGLLNSRQQQGNQNGDNGNDNANADNPEADADNGDDLPVRMRTMMTIGGSR